MKKVKIIDNTFKYEKGTMSFHKSEEIEIIKSSDVETDELLLITDNSLNKVDTYNGVKVAMLVEPLIISPASYEWIRKNHNKFYKVLTFDKDLLSLGENFEFYPHGGCWIETKDHMIYNKSKLLSIIASDKKTTEGHRLRHKIINVLDENKINIDKFGKYSDSFIEYKLDALKDFAFSFIIENSKRDFYFSEKLIDCLITGTVPIYWGCPSIGDFFDLNGMIIFDNTEDLLTKINSLSLEKYQSMLPSIKNNFELAKNYLTSEDWLFYNSDIFTNLKK